MQALDYLKAFGVSLLLLVSNVLIAFGVMAVYGHLIDPGHDQAYYEAAALRIAPWSSVDAGAALFFAAAWAFGIRCPSRNALVFALTFTVLYAAVDLAIIFAAGAWGQQLTLLALSLGSKFVAAVLGARLAVSVRARQ